MSGIAGDRRGLRMMVGIIAVILVAGALSLAEAVAAPIAFAFFIIALVWPIQREAQARMPAVLALLATMIITLIVVTFLALAIAWGFGRVARWVIANAAQLQQLYTQKIDWAESQGIALAGIMSEHFNVRSLVRMAQYVILQLQSAVSFLAVTLVFVILGLLEVGGLGRQLGRMGAETPTASSLLRAGGRTAAKLRSHMMVRTAMSVATGMVVWAFAYSMGLELAAEWGVIAFALNYIPFMGPLVATLFPTLFAVLQFGSWHVAVAVFLALQIIQFLSGSYIEPRLAGARLALSPFMVLVSVFLGAFLWGIPGAFIGVPMLIAILTTCEEFPGSRWVADLLSGREPPDRDVCRADAGIRSDPPVRH
jgi:predicted PurR-regulated permease PerM